MFCKKIHFALLLILVLANCACVRSSFISKGFKKFASIFSKKKPKTEQILGSSKTENIPPENRFTEQMSRQHFDKSGDNDIEQSQLLNQQKGNQEVLTKSNSLKSSVNLNSNKRKSFSTPNKAAVNKISEKDHTSSAQRGVIIENEFTNNQIELQQEAPSSQANFESDIERQQISKIENSMYEKKISSNKKNALNYGIFGNAEKFISDTNNFNNSQKISILNASNSYPQKNENEISDSYEIIDNYVGSELFNNRERQLKKSNNESSFEKSIIKNASKNFNSNSSVKCTGLSQQNGDNKSPQKFSSKNESANTRKKINVSDVKGNLKANNIHGDFEVYDDDELLIEVDDKDKPPNIDGKTREELLSILNHNYDNRENENFAKSLSSEVGQTQNSINTYMALQQLFDYDNDCKKEYNFDNDSVNFFVKNFKDKNFYYVFPASEKEFEKKLNVLLNEINQNIFDDNQKNRVSVIFFPYVKKPLIWLFFSHHIVLIKITIEPNFQVTAEYINSNTYIKTLLDSTSDLKKIIDKQFKNLFSANVKFIRTNVGSQGILNSTDCGRFVVSYIFAITHGRHPSELSYEQIYNMNKTLKKANF